MKNREKYKDSIMSGDFGCRDVEEFILKPNFRNCSNTRCNICTFMFQIWLDEDAEEDGFDWSKVEVDAPILVKMGYDHPWEKGHFAKYENGRVFAWNDGKTSHTTDVFTGWNFALLA